MDRQHNIILLSFTDPAGCAAAFEEAQKVPGVHEAAVLRRSAEGPVEAGDSWVRGAGVPTVGAGVVGALIGLLGGPLGSLIGAAAGAALAGAAEQHAYQEGGAALIELAALVGDGRSVVALDAHESSPDLVDELASSQGAEDVRRLDAKEFEKRVRAAEQAAEDTTGSGSDWPPGE